MERIFWHGRPLTGVTQYIEGTKAPADYVASPCDVAILERWFPNGDMCNPDWKAIEGVIKRWSQIGHSEIVNGVPDITGLQPNKLLRLFDDAKQRERSYNLAAASVERSDDYGLSPKNLAEEAKWLRDMATDILNTGFDLNIDDVFHQIDQSQADGLPCWRISVWIIYLAQQPRTHSKYRLQKPLRLAKSMCSAVLSNGILDDGSRLTNVEVANNLAKAANAIIAFLPDPEIESIPSRRTMLPIRIDKSLIEQTNPILLEIEQLTGIRPEGATNWKYILEEAGWSEELIGQTMAAMGHPSYSFEQYGELPPDYRSVVSQNGVRPEFSERLLRDLRKNCGSYKTEPQQVDPEVADDGVNGVAPAPEEFDGVRKRLTEKGWLLFDYMRKRRGGTFDDLVADVPLAWSKGEETTDDAIEKRLKHPKVGIRPKLRRFGFDFTIHNTRRWSWKPNQAPKAKGTK